MGVWISSATQASRRPCSQRGTDRYHSDRVASCDEETLSNLLIALDSIVSCFIYTLYTITLQNNE